MTRQFLFLFLTLLASFNCFAGPKAAECHGRPEFLSESRGSLLKGIESLPKLVFIGRNADYYVEGKNTNLKIWGRQSFIHPESKIVCASIPNTGAGSREQSFSIYAPTLIDLTGEKSIGDSFWQFHMMSDPQRLGIWNQKTRLFSKQNEIETQLGKMGVQVQVFQIAHDEFEMLLSRENELTKETLSIRFDTVSALR